jgi:hypothetical protein
MVDFLQYLGHKRSNGKYNRGRYVTFDVIWSEIAVGALVIIADGSIPYQFRDYPKKLRDSRLLEAWTDYTMPTITRDPSVPRSTNRYHKYRVYQKVEAVLPEEANPSGIPLN